MDLSSNNVGRAFIRHNRLWWGQKLLRLFHGGCVCRAQWIRFWNLNFLNPADFRDLDTTLHHMPFRPMGRRTEN
jgi:hypothetical protein